MSAGMRRQNEKLRLANTKMARALAHADTISNLLELMPLSWTAEQQQALLGALRQYRRERRGLVMEEPRAEG